MAEPVQLVDIGSQLRHFHSSVTAMLRVRRTSEQGDLSPTRCRAMVGPMAGAIAIVVALLLIPVLVLMSGGVFAAVFGQALEADAEQRNEGGELLELDD